MLAGTGLKPLFVEALGYEGAQRLGMWLRQALKGAKTPAPLLLSGDGAEELAGALAMRLMKEGHDVLPAPWSWVSPRRSGPPESLPRIAFLMIGLEEPREAFLDELARRSAVIAAGNVVPLIPGASGLLIDLPPERLEDLRLYEAAGWPVAAHADR